MANQTDKNQIVVRATVILRIPDLDTQELTDLYKMLNDITAKFGGEFDVTTAQQIIPPSETR